MLMLWTAERVPDIASGVAWLMLAFVWGIEAALDIRRMRMRAAIQLAPDLRARAVKAASRARAELESCRGRIVRP